MSRKYPLTAKKERMIAELEAEIAVAREQITVEHAEINRRNSKAQRQRNLATEAARRARDLADAVHAAERKLRELRRPAEPHTDVISFTVKLGNRHYDYAARRANGRWFTTGASCPREGWEWGGLIDWITAHDGLDTLSLR